MGPPWRGTVLLRPSVAVCGLRPSRRNGPDAHTPEAEYRAGTLRRFFKLPESKPHPEVVRLAT